MTALLLSPVATELPEIMNAVIWVRQGKTPLALANISGAMKRWQDGDMLPAVGGRRHARRVSAVPSSEGLPPSSLIAPERCVTPSAPTSRQQSQSQPDRMIHQEGRHEVPTASGSFPRYGAIPW